jgi:hypothetical protein
MQQCRIEVNLAVKTLAVRHENVVTARPIAGFGEGLQAATEWSPSVRVLGRPEASLPVTVEGSIEKGTLTGVFNPPERSCRYVRDNITLK